MPQRSVDASKAQAEKSPQHKHLVFYPFANPGVSKLGYSVSGFHFVGLTDSTDHHHEQLAGGLWSCCSGGIDLPALLKMGAELNSS